MNPAGVVLILAGAWAIAQVWRGEALERLQLAKAVEGGVDAAIEAVP